MKQILSWKWVMMGIKRNFLLLIQIRLKENCYPKYVHFIQIQIFKQLFLENNLFIFNIGQWPHIFKGKFFTGVHLHFFWISTVYHLIHMTCFQPVKIQTSWKGCLNVCVHFGTLKNLKIWRKGSENYSASVNPCGETVRRVCSHEYLSSQSILVPRVS